MKPEGFEPVPRHLIPAMNRFEMALSFKKDGSLDSIFLQERQYKKNYLLFSLDQFRRLCEVDEGLRKFADSLHELVKDGMSRSAEFAASKPAAGSPPHGRVSQYVHILSEENQKAASGIFEMVKGDISSKPMYDPVVRELASKQGLTSEQVETLIAMLNADPGLERKIGGPFGLFGEYKYYMRK